MKLVKQFLAFCISAALAFFTTPAIVSKPDIAPKHWAIKWRQDITTFKASVIFYSGKSYNEAKDIIINALISFKEFTKEVAFLALQNFVNYTGAVKYASPNPLPNFAPFILEHLAEVVGGNAPETKIAPTGFLKAALENDPQVQLAPGEEEKLRINTGTGNIKQVRLSYLQRFLPSQTSTTDDCENEFIPTYNDYVLQAPLFRKFSFLITDDTMAHYLEDAAKITDEGIPPTKFMNEFLRTITSGVTNALLGAIDIDLGNQVVWGVNAVTGTNAAVAVNIEQDATKFNLSTGWAKLLDQLDQNEFGNQAPIIVHGNGIWNQFMRSRSFQSSKLSGLNDGGYNDFKDYFDLYCNSQITTFATNQIGVFAKGAFGFVDLNKYVGPWRSGLKGISYFFQIELPVAEMAESDGTQTMMKFDCQLKYIDCPTTVYNGYANVTVTRGWQLIISKNYGLFQLPPDAYQGADSLYGNNGALLYTISNNV